MTTLTSHARPSRSLRNALVNMLPALLVMLGILIAASSARAATFTVTNTADTGAGSLREAITSANDTIGADTINFNIPGAGVHTISPQSRMPEITEALTIDGYSQPGTKLNTLAVGTNAVLLIELDGTAAGDNRNGLFVIANGCTIRGMVINRFDGSGILIHSSANVVQGNFIGTDPTGNLALGSGADGVIISLGSGGNLIGGAQPSARNIISANGDNGVNLYAMDAKGDRVQGNLIGTNAHATKRLPNMLTGIVIRSDDTLIGGAASGEGNVISSESAGVSASFTASNITILRQLHRHRPDRDARPPRELRRLHQREYDGRRAHRWRATGSEKCHRLLNLFRYQHHRYQGRYRFAQPALPQ